MLYPWCFVQCQKDVNSLNPFAPEQKLTFTVTSLRFHLFTTYRSSSWLFLFSPEKISLRDFLYYNNQISQTLDLHPIGFNPSISATQEYKAWQAKHDTAFSSQLHPHLQFFCLDNQSVDSESVDKILTYCLPIRLQWSTIYDPPPGCSVLPGGCSHTDWRAETTENGCTLPFSIQACFVHCQCWGKRRTWNNVICNPSN